MENPIIVLIISFPVFRAGIPVMIGRNTDTAVRRNFAAAAAVNATIQIALEGGRQYFELTRNENSKLI